MIFNETNPCCVISFEIVQMWAPFGESLDIQYFGHGLNNLSNGQYEFLTSNSSIPIYYINELLYSTQAEVLRVLNRYPLYVISPQMNSSIKGLSKKKQHRFLKMAKDFHLKYSLSV